MTKKAPAPAKAAKKLTIQEKLTALETRLKRANTVTRKNVKTLEQVVASLETTSKKTQSSQKAAFTRKVNAINKKLTSLMDGSQTAIAKDLSAAMASPASGDDAYGNLEAALGRANERLAQTELAQSAAISKVNRHVANLATAIEARFETEKAARDAAITASETKFDEKLDSVAKTSQDLTQKLETVETDTAEALEVLGEKIENFAVELDQRQNRSDTNMGGKVSEIALQTQAELESFRSDIDARLNTLPSANQPRVEGQMAILQDRLDNLEQYIADMNLQAPSQQVPSQPAPSDAAQTNTVLNSLLPGQPQPSTALAPPLPTSTNMAAPMAAPAPTNVVPINDAFAPANAPSNPYASAPAPAQEASSNPVDQTPEKDSHIPVEFDPAAYQSATAATATAYPSLSESNPDLPSAPMATPIAATPVSAPPPIPSPELPPMSASTPDNNPQSDAHYASLAGMDAPKLQDLEPSSNDIPSLESLSADQVGAYVEPELPYADPAYAESESPRAERIGEPLTGKKGKKLKLPKSKASKPSLKGSPLRFLLTGSALALLLLFAGKMVLGAGDKKYAPVVEAPSVATQPAVNPFQTNQTQPQASTQFTAKSGLTIDTDTQAAPIGQYVETITPTISAAEQKTLKGAAASKNPIAQYQLGLTHLKSSETNPDELEVAVTLIRAAAAQNLPPAQYRLAKLYEIGQGVQADASQARQLIERAAKSGHRIAMHDLALYYTDGRGGVSVDVPTAEKWFEQAAQHGVVDSQFNLAVLSESKPEPTRDVEKAFFWYNIAAQQGDQIAKQRVNIISEGLSPEQLEAVQARVAAFTPRPVNPEVNGVFTDVPWAQPVQSVKIEQIRQAQSYLAELGYAVGTADGAMGPNTRKAITEFEKAYDLPATGKVSDTLIDKLELAVGA